MLTQAARPSQHRIVVDAEYQTSGVWTGLRGADVERIERNHGSATVVPLVQLPDNLSGWLGYQEVWDLELGRSPYAFRQASLTVHVGEVGDPVKPQLLRLEWPGLRDWDRSGIGFQSPGAGHPHWQLDLLESLAALRDPAEFDPDRANDLEDFETIVAEPTLADRLSRLTVERMHLASAAPWWAAHPGRFGAPHLNAPTTQDDLTRWLAASTAYVIQELSRCALRR
ncbi:hypothetical protein EN866_34490 [Mesorhizobium sp. M2D.F.Ca.ET.223.01.1.1]|uniref:hypothetical protein n=2 Tax=unclassified Mesorhizobium TaxID=325217 RepID=UPI0010920531|nr:hypothetical protein [Mesorhizobium sp. M2D.F.Ca.ET.223.01.1.1]TGR83014.1 hypothetical protein EN866_34490 [Mesorhizobium sp. M2D.F.Ca.ET.223.01.1.1]TGT70848.1 hypothetical protein EN802_21260 [bacterium M00.F.Ca.ET.159.01.1.1]TGT82491.1 hypothetical protein EN800_19420 [bacterium M00.F.Ca.ET.157.01.1.1]